MTASSSAENHGRNLLVSSHAGTRLPIAVISESKTLLSDSVRNVPENCHSAFSKKEKDT